jgi:hypothetical protein
MTTLITRDAGAVQLLDDLDFAPTQPPVPDHALGRLWYRTLNAHQPVGQSKPDHPIATCYSQTVGHDLPPVSYAVTGHPIATLWTRMVAKPALYT